MITSKLPERREVTKMPQGITTWVVVGIIAGLLARLFVPGRNRAADGLLSDVVAGLIGAAGAGWVYRRMGHYGLTGVNLESILAAFAGAVFCLLVWRALTGPNTGRRPA